MFKTILKIAVLSATAITLLSACGAATRALNSAADDALNAALAKAEKRYTEAISNLKDDNGDPLKVYIDDDGTPFHVTIDENGEPIKVTIDDKINSIKVKTDDKGNPIQVTIDDFGNPIVTTATAFTTAEICSSKSTWDLWQSPCDNDEVSIQRFHELCLDNLFSRGCADDDRYNDARHELCVKYLFNPGCTDNDRYNDARHETCLNDPFHWGCAGNDRYNDVRIKFCNSPANVGHDACVAPLEPQVNSDRYTSPGYIQNQFLQGTADGLNTGSLHTSLSDATAPVVHILKLSDSDVGVAFFGGIAPVLDEKQFAPGWKYYYAGILPDPNLGAPITQTNGTAVWQGTFSVIDSVSYVSDVFRTDKDFELQIDFATQQLSASINGVKNKDKNNQLEPNLKWIHSDYSLSGVFSDGKIEGRLYATRVVEDNGGQEINWVARGARVQGLIGQDGAVAAFVADDNPFSGGFVARPPSE